MKQSSNADHNSSHQPPSLTGVLVSDSPQAAVRVENALRRAGLAVRLLHAAPDSEAAFLRISADLYLLDQTSPISSLEASDRLAQAGQSRNCVIDINLQNIERIIADVAHVWDSRVVEEKIEQWRSHIEDAQQQAALSLRESEERYRALIESTFDLICELDSEGRCTYASTNFCRRLGFGATELTGKLLFDRIHIEDVEKVLFHFAGLFDGKASEPIEFRHAHKTGQWVWLEGSMRMLHTGTPQHFVLIARDITERRRHEQERSALIALAKAINAQRDLMAIAREVKVHLRELIPFETLRVARLSGHELSVVSTPKSPSDASEAMEVLTRRAQHPIWKALERREVWMEDQQCKAADSEGIDPQTAHACIKVPLIVEGECIGLLDFEADKPGVFTEDHLRLAGMAGEQVAVAIRQVRLLEKALQAETKYRELVQDVEAIVWEADPASLCFSFVSPRAENWLGFPLSDWLETPDFWSTHLYPDDKEQVLAARRRAVENGEDFVLEYRVLTAQGKVLWLRDLGSVETRDGKVVNVRGLMVDITSHKQYESTILERNTILGAVQEAVTDGVCVMDANECPISYNRRFIEMWPIPDEMMDELRDKRQVMAFVSSQVEEAGAFLKKVSDLKKRTHELTHDEVRLKDGRLFEVFSSPALAEDGRWFGRVWSLRDITEQESYEQRLTYQAFHDPLTDLPNRALYMDRLRHAIERANRVARLTGVIFLDLDRFKVVNDSLGHPVGDELLKQVAARIARSTRPHDTAARFGGDEFTVLVEDIASAEDATQVARRILESLQAPFHLAGHEVHITGSIGIALSTSAEDSADDLLRKADVAMYWSKNKGRGHYEVFDANMSAQALERLQLEIDLRQAIKRGQLRLRYQPLVHLASGRIIGAEALVRWQHPTRGLVAPDEFIPLAEETGLILGIGSWVLRAACEQAHAWQSEFPHDPPLKISVNLSPRQLEQPELSLEIERVLNETHLDANTLELEITESAVMQNVQANIEHLETIKKLGVRLAIDDFGTGYSSLSYLEHFPLDALKIDRAFVSQIGMSPPPDLDANGSESGLEKSDGLAILKAVSTLGRTLGVCVTAEGIETVEQRMQLAALSCEIGQGFHFSEPLEVAAVNSLLRHGSHF